MHLQIMSVAGQPCCCRRSSHCALARHVLVALCRELFTAEFVEGGIDLMAGVSNAAHAWAQAHAFSGPDRWLLSVGCGTGKLHPCGRHIHTCAVCGGAGIS
jgi:hypothetical protein